MAISPVSDINWFWPFLIAAIIALAASFLTFYLLDRQQKQKKYAWLVDIMAECKDRPMGMMADKGGKLIPFAIEHDKKNKGLIEHKRYTLVHPDITPPETKHRIMKGPETSFFPLPYYFPFSIQDSAALVQLAQMLRKDNRFSWIANEPKLLALLFNKTKSFSRDARELIESSVSFGDEIPDGYLDRDEGELIDDEFTENELIDDEFTEDEDKEEEE